jgi:hypothetical protein
MVGLQGSLEEQGMGTKLHLALGPDPSQESFVHRLLSLQTTGAFWQVLVALLHT